MKEFVQAVEAVSSEGLRHLMLRATSIAEYRNFNVADIGDPAVASLVLKYFEILAEVAPERLDTLKSMVIDAAERGARNGKPKVIVPKSGMI